MNTDFKINLQIADNFYQQIFMFFSKPNKRLQPLPSSVLSKKNIHTSNHSKRALSLKPISISNNKVLKLNSIKEVLEVNQKMIKNPREYLKEIRREPVKKFDNLLLKNPHSKTRTTSVNSVIRKKQGMTERQLYERKESNLNSYFNIRMSKLKDITKENKRIYERLNSQKSLYSSKNLDQSYQENCNISRRLSQSKISKSSSRCSISSKKPKAKSLLKKGESNLTKAKQTIKFQSHNIKNVGNGEVQRYLQIFCNNNANRESFNKKEIIMQTFSKNRRVDKQNKGMYGKDNLEGIIQQFKVRQRNKKPISLARLL